MSDPRPLPPKVEEQYIGLATKGRKAREAGDFDAAERFYLEAWNVIPEPKLEYDYAGSMTAAMTNFYRENGRIEQAKSWLALAREAYGPDPDPYTEFIAAKVHYAAGEFQAAFELFDQLFQQFRRRPFQGEDPIYLEFYLERSAVLKEGKTPVDPVLPGVPGTQTASPDSDVPLELPDDIYERVEALSEEGNVLMEDGDNEGAEAVWRQALDLLPEPKTEWEAYMWLNASIGEACYFQENYADAVQVLFDALNAPGGPENPFVHYMLGKALWQIGEDEDRAVDELLRAYMLDGVDIFDGDEEEGPDMLQLLIDRGLVEPDED
ncbi:tetratricopeptide repeat protein [Bordetella genomosp. 13]|uniref:tetratricopeptide repeat protein n=1 Tax=Bordetella genomosp. 13 TaxID=463040 RepID=UPI001E3C2FFB|nr:tetratricopeptide repeat protein [Bordetella genomosp. 13]